MIALIDHLAFATQCINDDMDTFRELGYEAEFVETDMQDLENKRAIMEVFSGKLDMALLKRSGSIGIELLNHGHEINEDSFLHPIFEGVIHEVTRLDEPLVVADSTFVKVRSEKLRAEFFMPEEPLSAEFNCNKVIVDAQSVDQSVAFWKNFGFKHVAIHGGVAQLSFRPLVGGGTCEMYVREKRGRTKRSLLDTRGFNCIAFFSSNAKKDRQKYMKLGIKATEVNHFRVGGKNLSIHWLQGPGDEIVEIVGLE